MVDIPASVLFISQTSNASQLLFSDGERNPEATLLSAFSLVGLPSACAALSHPLITLSITPAAQHGLPAGRREASRRARFNSTAALLLARLHLRRYTTSLSSISHQMVL